jgi:DNA helicase-2/ATP-dependent DNA helicase PcrA
VSRRPSRFLYGLGDGAPQSSGARGAKAPANACACGRPLLAAGERKAGRCDSCLDAAVDPALAERLRAWRRERASDDGVPAYVVFNDRTLRDLAGRRPGSAAELLDVHGFGRAKVARYGDDVLRIVSGR